MNASKDKRDAWLRRAIMMAMIVAMFAGNKWALYGTVAILAICIEFQFSLNDSVIGLAKDTTALAETILKLFSKIEGKSK